MISIKPNLEPARVKLMQSEARRRLLGLLEYKVKEYNSTWILKFSTRSKLDREITELHQVLFPERFANGERVPIPDWAQEEIGFKITYLEGELFK